MDGSRNQSARLGGGTTCTRVSIQCDQSTNESETGLHERHWLLTRQGRDNHGQHHCSQFLSYPIRHCWAPSSDELGQEPNIAGTVFFFLGRGKRFRYRNLSHSSAGKRSAQRAADRRNRYSITCGKCQAHGVMIGQLTALSVRIPRRFVPKTAPTLTRQSVQVPAMRPC